MRKWVLWGHQFSEYQGMFDLPNHLSKKNILELACGPTLVNQELNHYSRIVSCDPWFSNDLADIKQKFTDSFKQQVDNIRRHPERFDLNSYGGIDNLIAARHSNMEKFFADYALGWQDKRYQQLHVPNKLAFASSSFDLALCANFLFTDLPEQDIEFHIEFLKEMARVAHDVRIYPLTNYKAKPAKLLGPILLALQQQGYQVSIQDVSFRFVPESKAMLSIKSGRCDL